MNSGSGGRLRERRACRGWGVVAVEELVALEGDAEAMGMVVGETWVGEPCTDVRTVLADGDGLASLARSLVL